MRTYSEIFKTLSDENRLRILEMLSCGELCACDIQENLKISQPTISHHMRTLQQVGIINVEKRGKWAFYSINQKQIDDICDFIKKITAISENKSSSISQCDCDGNRR